MSQAKLAFRLSTLLGWLTFFAVISATIATGSQLLSGVVQFFFLISLCWAIVMSIAMAGGRRCFWLGYLVFAVLYFAAVWGSLEWLGIDDQELPTSRLVTACVEQLHPSFKKQVGINVFEKRFPLETKIARLAFHHAFAIVFGCGAGLMAKSVYERCAEPEAKP